MSQLWTLLPVGLMMIGHLKMCSADLLQNTVELCKIIIIIILLTMLWCCLHDIVIADQTNRFGL